MKQLTFHARRSAAAWAQAVLILGLPFVRVGGESALRFDVPTLKLYFFGSVIWISEAYFFLLVFLLFFIGVMLFTVLYGRIWCGWMCPQTVLSDFSRRIELISAWFGGHSVLRTTVSQALLFLFSAVIAASLIWYFVSPYDMAGDIANGSLGPWTFWSWALFTGLIYLNLAFVRHRFCGTVCPYARLQSAFFDDKTLTIAFDQSRSKECAGCEACVRSCPAGIDIRDGLQVECINCAECIDACARQRERSEKKSLIGYFRGTGADNGQTRPRPRVFGLSAAFAFIAVLFAYQVYVRMPVDFWVMRDERQSYHQTGVQDALMNSYQIVIENRSLRTESYRLSVSGINNAELVMPQNPLIIPPNSAVTLRAYILAQRRDLVLRITRLNFTLQNTASREIRVVQEAPFVYPERTEKGVEI